MDTNPQKTISNKEASDKMLSARLKLVKLEDDLKTNFEAFKLVDVKLIEKLKGNLLMAAYRLLEGK